MSRHGCSTELWHHMSMCHTYVTDLQKPWNPCPQPGKPLPSKPRVGFEGYRYGLAWDTPGLPMVLPTLHSYSDFFSWCSFWKMELICTAWCTYEPLQTCMTMTMLMACSHHWCSHWQAGYPAISRTVVATLGFPTAFLSTYSSPHLHCSCSFSCSCSCSCSCWFSFSCFSSCPSICWET